MPYCRKCLSETREGDLLCGQCGAKFSVKKSEDAADDTSGSKNRWLNAFQAHEEK